jgi:uncharacterized protein
MIGNMHTNSKERIPRLLTAPNRSFFLFGPRGTGKSTWLQESLPEAFTIDLLDASLFLELSGDPHRLEGLISSRPAGSWVVLDEIQKIPMLLDEVHRLMGFREAWKFVLCGSSARKLKRGGANLLAGRALTLNMEGFSACELGERFDLQFALDWGMLPFVWNDPTYAADIISAYLNTYLKEELQAEGLIRKVPPFIRFLSIAGQANAQVLNGQNIAREAAVARSTVDNYFGILTDTLVGHFLPAWRPGLKVREAAGPKFYWFDPGVARASAGLLRDPTDRIWQGAALETLVYHELRVYNDTSRKQRPLYYYRTPAGVEIDFIIETSSRLSKEHPHVIAIEVKRSEKWNRSWEKPMRSLSEGDRVTVDGMFGVYCGTRTYQFDGIMVLPVFDFIQALFKGDVF